jgi:hypothetical protein
MRIRQKIAFVSRAGRRLGVNIQGTGQDAHCRLFFFCPSMKRAQSDHGRNRKLASIPGPRPFDSYHFARIIEAQVLGPPTFMDAVKTLINVLDGRQSIICLMSENRVYPGVAAFGDQTGCEQATSLRFQAGRSGPPMIRR